MTNTMGPGVLPEVTRRMCLPRATFSNCKNQGPESLSTQMLRAIAETTSFFAKLLGA